MPKTTCTANLLFIDSKFLLKRCGFLNLRALIFVCFYVKLLLISKQQKLKT